MIDIQLLRKNPEAIATRLASRGLQLDLAEYKKLEARRKDIDATVQQTRADRNQIAHTSSVAVTQGQDITSLKDKGELIRTRLESLERELEEVQKSLDNFLLQIPNIPHESVPLGHSPAENRVERFSGQAVHSSTAKDHVEIGEPLGLDFAAATKVSGARFVVMKGQTARLHRAISQFMLDLHTEEHGYTEVYAPYIVNDQSLLGTGQLPKFEHDLFQVSFGGSRNTFMNADVLISVPEAYPNVPASLKVEKRNWYLIPTAEVPVTNLVRDETISFDKLPLRYVCHTPCFRSEAGSHGKDTRGMIRQHQFDKVELVQISHPDHSYQQLEELTGHAEAVLKKLDLPYRVITLCTGDMGAAAAKTYDLEVWLPSQQGYREISSCSNFEAYQARRMKARFRSDKSKKSKSEFVHTLNGSGLAVGRTLVAILENFQNTDGSVAIPLALRRYMNGAEKLTPP